MGAYLVFVVCHVLGWNGSVEDVQASIVYRQPLPFIQVTRFGLPPNKNAYLLVGLKA